MRHKKIAIAGIAASMLAGAGTGLVLNIPGGAGASDAAVTATTPDDGSTTDTTDTTDATVTTDDSTVDDDSTDNADRPMRGHGVGDFLDELVTAGTITQEQSDAITAAIENGREAAQAAAAEGTRPERGALLTDTLTELVTAGTITQEQSDAITAAIEANRPDGGHGGPGGFGQGQGQGHGPGHGPGRGGPGRGMSVETAATALGITADELRTELESGKTIAEVAADKGIDVQTVIDAIVAEQTADITERVTDMVNGVMPTRPADDDDPATDDAATTTTTG